MTTALVMKIAYWVGAGAAAVIAAYLYKKKTAPAAAPTAAQALAANPAVLQIGMPFTGPVGSVVQIVPPPGGTFNGAIAWSVPGVLQPAGTANVFVATAPGAVSMSCPVTAGGATTYLTSVVTVT